MHFLTVYLVAVLISTEGVGRTEQMKVGQPPSCGVTGASRTNFASGAGLTWNMVGGVAWWLQIKYDNKNK